MSQITIEKSTMTVKDVDAKITAMALKLTTDDTLAVSRNYATAEMFKNVTVPKLKQATIDLLVSTHKDKQQGAEILMALNAVLNPQNLIDVAKSRNYSLLISKGDHDKEGTKLYHDRMSKQPELKAILKHTIFSNQEANYQDIDSLLETCIPTEFEPYKDYEKFRKRVTLYDETPLYLLEHYKDYLKDQEVLTNILLKDSTKKVFMNDNRKKITWSERYCESLYAIQTHIATIHANNILRSSTKEKEIGINSMYMSRQTSRLGEALLAFLERHAKAFDVSVKIIVKEEVAVAESV